LVLLVHNGLIIGLIKTNPFKTKPVAWTIWTWSKPYPGNWHKTLSTFC